MPDASPTFLSDAGEAPVEPTSSNSPDVPGLEEMDPTIDPLEDDEADEPAPPVVALLVTSDPGPWLEVTLGALKDQDYPNLAVIVIDAASEIDPTERIADVLPSAFVRRLQEDKGFPSNANEVIGMVEGATHIAFCHDDAAADPSAIRILVEEAFRSNAGVVAPKMVRWDDSTRILSVGMNADKLGALADRVIPGEVDQEQHDSVRDVFVAPGGFTLIRADLFSALGGFDPKIRMFGEDLDFCWRAQLAGARVVVAPSARVRHIEVTRSGTQWRAGVASGDDVRRLVRRNELRTMLKCYSTLSLLRVVPQAVLASVAEIVIALGAGKVTRAATILSAWKWNLFGISELRIARRDTQMQRRLPDSEVREYQVHGLARVSTLAHRIAASYQGVHRLSLHGVEGSGAQLGDEVSDDAGRVEGSIGQNTSEITEADLDERPELMQLMGRWSLPSPSWVAPIWVLVLMMMAFGMRHWMSASLPVVGELDHVPGPLSLVHSFVDAGRALGTGSYSSAPPAFFILGSAGTVLAGATGFLQKLLFLGALPIGALGLFRLVRPIGSRLSSVLALVTYVVVPLPYNLFSSGKFQDLIVYAASPWVIGRMLQISGYEPFIGSRAPVFRSWLTLGILLALVSSLAPAEMVVVGIVSVGLLLGKLLVSREVGMSRVLGLAFLGSTVAVALLFPWEEAFVGKWHGLIPLLGQGGPVWSAPNISDLVHFGTGQLSTGWVGWALLIPAGLGVAIGAGWRFAWAARLWGIMLASWAAAWAGVHGWLGSPSVDTGAILVPGAIALALSVGVGARAFELDLTSHRFGWRQAMSGLSAVCLFIAAIPVLGFLAGGQLGLPAFGWGSVLSGVSKPQAVVSTHTSSISAVPGGLSLWLGDPRAIPINTWPLSQGVGFGLSSKAVPSITNQWLPVSEGEASLVGQAILQARAGSTTQLGMELANNYVQYIVVPLELAPGTGRVRYSPAPWVLPTLQAQSDLKQVEVDPSMAYFVNSDYRVGKPSAGHGGTPTVDHAPGYRYLELLVEGILWILAIWMVADRAISRMVGTLLLRRPR